MKKKKDSKQATPVKPSKTKPTAADTRSQYLALIGILGLSFIVYLPVLQNGFVWDDELYIQSNPLIQSFNLKEIFAEDVAGNYHPLTILTLAIEYRLFGLKETGYHIVNLLLHLLNVVLTFYSIKLLSKNVWVALIAALLFGIHPLHVESVAWAAELKDLLYTLFFLASFVFYLRYTDKGQRKFYFLALLMFLFSLLSKAMAASLPLVLMLADYFRGRKSTAASLSEKVPFFFMALAFGIAAIYAQQSSGAIEVVSFPFYQRIFFACYGFITYLVKLLLPLNLSAYYPYPIKSGETLPLSVYLYAIAVLGLVIVLLYYFKGNKRVIFGFSFFAATVLLVLQLLPVGGAIMADRYTYIPSIGIFYLLSEGAVWLWSRNQKGVVIGALTILSLIYCATTYARTKIWKSEMTLWNDVIQKYQTVPLAYYNRGSAYLDEKNYKLAFDDFSKAIELNPNHWKAYVNRGTVLSDIGKNAEALNDFNKAIEINSESAWAYNNRGNLLMREKKFDQALADYHKAIRLKPTYEDAYSNRGIVYAQQGRKDEAYKDFSKAIALKPTPAVHINRGFLLIDEEKLDEALVDFNKAAELNPANPTPHYHAGTVFMKQKKYDLAINSFSKAVHLKADYAAAYFQKGLAEYYSDNKNAACFDLKQAASLKYPPATEAIAQLCN